MLFFDKGSRNAALANWHDKRNTVAYWNLSYKMFEYINTISFNIANLDVKNSRKYTNNAKQKYCILQYI